MARVGASLGCQSNRWHNCPEKLPAVDCKQTCSSDVYSADSQEARIIRLSAHFLCMDAVPPRAEHCSETTMSCKGSCMWNMAERCMRVGSRFTQRLCFSEAGVLHGAQQAHACPALVRPQHEAAPGEARAGRLHAPHRERPLCTRARPLPLSITSPRCRRRHRSHQCRHACAVAHRGPRLAFGQCFDGPQARQQLTPVGKARAERVTLTPAATDAANVA